MTLWANIRGFSYHYFDPFEDAPELKPFEQLIAVWRSKCQGNRIPAWSDFDFTDFAGWHSKLAIYDFSYDPFDYKIRLSGEQFNEALDRNMKGMTRGQLLEIAVENEIADKFHEKIAREMLVAYSLGINIVDRQHVQVEILELPLSDDGVHGTHSIEVIIPRKTKNYVMQD